MANSDDQLWQLLRLHRGSLFSRPQDLKDIALGRVKVPKKYKDEVGLLNDAEVRVLTFGQLLAYYAELRRMDIAAVAEQCGITPDTVIRLYDDTILPWDLTIRDITQLATSLGIPFDVVVSAVKRQPLENDILLERMPGSAMVARTAKNLDGSAREKDLRESNIAIQRNREDRKRQALLTDLRVH